MSAKMVTNGRTGQRLFLAALHANIQNEWRKIERERERKGKWVKERFVRQPICFDDDDDDDIHKHTNTTQEKSRRIIK